MKDFCDAVRALAIEYNCGLIDIYAETQSVDMGKFLNKGDGIHQSPEGHAMWAAYVSDYLLAAYDGKNAATVSVECKEGDETVASYTLKAAIGSSLYVPAKKLVGCKLADEIRLVKVDGDMTVSYSYEKASGGVRGDADGNGKTEAKDYMMLKRHILGTFTISESTLANADIDGNGKVESKDYMMLKRVILGTYTLPEA